MDDDERQDLIGRLFALITSKFEDGAGLAVDGQSRERSIETKAELAGDLQALATELTVLCEAGIAICAG